MDSHVAEAGDVLETKEEAGSVSLVRDLIGGEAVVEEDQEDGEAAE
jgi:hypothetical protein